MNKTFFGRILMAAAFFAITAPLAAAPIYVRANPNAPLDFGLLRQGSLAGVTGTNVGGSYKTLYSGQFDLEISDNAAFLGAQSILAYCFEPLQSISSGHLNPYRIFDTVVLDTSSITSTILTNQQVNLVSALWSNAFELSTASGSDLDVRAAAFQWLIWDILLDVPNVGSVDLLNGNLRVSGTAGGITAAVRTLGTQWATNLNSGTWNTAQGGLHVLQHSGSQDLVYVQNPEPGTMILMGLGLVSMGIIRRRRTR